VFPCARDKKPAIPKDKGGRGFLDATTDNGEIARLFAAPGCALVGCPTGEVSGFDVLDLDYRHGAKEWEAENAHRLPETRIHTTQSGGRHYLFRHVHGVRNSAGRVAPGIDVRGAGGYVVLPPSDGYSVANDADVAEWPDWLLQPGLVFPKEPEPRVNGKSHQPASTARMEAMLRIAIDKVASAGEGQKHFTLRNQALWLGGLLHYGGFSRAQALDALMNALPSTVKDRKAAQKTAEWGLDCGAGDPIDLADSPEWIARQKSNGHDHSPPPLNTQARPAVDGDNLAIFPVEYFIDVNPVTQAQDFVEGLLIEQTMSVIYGESNSGKTFFATNLAFHVAAGWPWEGREVERGAVIYCALEGGNGIRNRVSALKTHHGLDGQDLPFAVIPVTINMLDPEQDIEMTIRTIRHVAKHFNLPVRLTVMDTLSRAMAGGNENAPDDMGALVTNGARIQQETRSHLCWVHHSGKDQAKGARGHSLLRAATDTEIEITADDGSRMGRVTKQRDLECVGEFPFSLQVVELGTNHRGKPVTSCVVIPISQGEQTGKNGKKRDYHLTVTAQLALRALSIALSKSGAQLPPLPDYPANTVAVPASEWRKEFNELKAGSSPDTLKHAFHSGQSALLAAELITARNGLVWMVSRNSETGK
jgi:hypothetical protein